MQDTGETQSAVNTGPTFQDALTALNAVLPKPKDGGDRNDFEIVTAAEREINRLREFAALPIAAEVPESTPGWREIAYEEPPYDKNVLFKRNGETPYVGYSVKPDPDDDTDDGHGLLIRIDGDLYDGDPPNLWSEIPDYYYDDVAAIAQTLDGDDDSDDDADTAEEDDDSEVYYRNIDDPPPVDVPVLLLMHNTTNQPKEPFIGWINKDGAYFTEDMDGERQEVGCPDYWSFLPRLPAIPRPLDS